MTAVLSVLIILFIMSLYRLVFGPSFQDRLLGLSMASTLLVLMLCVSAVLFDRSFFLDIAMIYALLSFGEITAFVKVHHWRTRRDL